MTEIIDNRAHRIRVLKGIIQRLHESQGAAPPEEVKAQLKALVRHTDATEIAAMEQELIAEGMPVDEVRAMCNLHAEVLQEILVEPPGIETLPGHPLDTFHRENEAIQVQAAEMRAAVDVVRRRPGPEELAAALDRWRRAYQELMDVEKHYQRKENLLFARLEKYGITGPSRVMWAKDDEIRQLLKRVGRIIARDDLTLDELVELIDTTADPALDEIEGMVFKEEQILLPMAAATLTDDDWADIWRDAPEYGWCLVEPGEEYQPPEAASPPPAAEIPAERSIVFPTGALTPEQIRGLLTALPVDLTFVDADDRVRYFSEGAGRIFARSKTILGRKVQHCHPPGSVHVVQKIVDDFREGKRDHAEFWIEFRGRFVHIRYFPVRDGAGTYLGTLEVTQDLTPLRALSGERRLLDDEA